MEVLFKFFLRTFFWVKGYRFYQVYDENEEAEAIKFSSKLFLDAGYPHAYLDLQPRYFQNSILLVARHRGKMIATMRMIDPRGNCRINDFWNIEYPEEFDLGELRELGTLAVDEAYRGKTRLPFTGLLEVAFQYSRRNGVKCWFSSSSEANYKKFKAMNPTCRLMNELEPGPLQLEFREKYSTYFKNRAESTMVFCFDLKEASYTKHVKRVLKRKLGAKPKPAYG